MLYIKLIRIVFEFSGFDERIVKNSNVLLRVIG